MQKIPLVDLKAQYTAIKNDIDTAIAEILEATSFIMGSPVARFEKEFARFCGAGYCIGVGSGTDALTVALKACGIGPGDEVITAANTFIATTEAITMAGAKIVLADVDPHSSTLDPTCLSKALSKATRAIIPVHLYGHCADMDPVLEFANAHNLLVIEDCAQAHGATYKGRAAGTMGAAGCFSFFPGKNLGAYGDAGAIITNDSKIAETAAMYRNHGRAPSKKYEHDFEGYNFRLDALQAAILSAKLPHLPEWTRRRQWVAQQYHSLLADAAGMKLPPVSPDISHVYHLFVVRLTDIDRSALRQHLQNSGIASGIHYPIPLHLQPAYSHLGQGPGTFPVAEEFAGQILSLPIYPELSQDAIKYICTQCREFIA